MSFCYGKAVLELWPERFGLDASIPINVHLQAVLMVLTAAAAVAGLWRDRSEHGAYMAFAAGMGGLGVLLWSIYVHYHRVVEFSAYIALVSAVFLNQNHLLGALARAVETQARELEGWNAQLERRVAEQVAQLGGLERLRRFFSPPLARLIESGGEDPLRPHRREVTVMFIDLRGFTAFAEASEPEEVMAVLREYHAEVGGMAEASQANIERFAGDGIMIMFNDPVPVPDPVGQAVRMALVVRERMQPLIANWRRRGHALGFGIGIAKGYATIGAIGHASRYDYAAIGTVTNLAARLCGEAADGQILVNQKTLAVLEGNVHVEPVGALQLKGLRDPVVAFNVMGIVSASEA
jgi:class 3 adenylate cyclase